MAKRKLSFEEALKRLEEITQTLENEDVSLENSISLYKEGMDIAALCKNNLAKAKAEVLLIQKNAKGDVVEEPFIPKEN